MRCRIAGGGSEMQALSLLTNIMTDTPQVLIVKERCLRRRLSTNGCRRCLDVCDPGALTLTGRHIHLDTEKCNNCMRCLVACPNDALTSEYDLENTLQTIGNQNQVVFSCTRRKQAYSEEITVPCLGVFSAVSLFALGTMGKQSIIFNIAGCSTCDNKDIISSFLATRKLVVDLTSHLLNTDLVVSEDIKQDITEKVAARRSFFSSLTIKKPRPRKQTDTEKSSRRIPCHVRIVEKIIATAMGESREELLALCTHQLTVNTECTYCPRCTGICPTGALKIDNSGKEKQLLFRSTRCSGCGLCVSFCQQKALSLSFSPLSGLNS